MIMRALSVVALAGVLASTTLAQTQPDRTRSTTPPPRNQTPQPSRGNLVDLRPRFTVGQEVRLNMDMSSTSTRTGNTADEPATDADGSRTVGMTIVLKCTAADPEEGYSLDMKIESFRIDGTIEGQPIKWDSKKQGKDEVLDAAFGSIVGTSLPVTMDKNGNISNVGGGLGGALGGKMGGADMFKGMFGPISTRTTNTGEAKVGDKWTNDDTMQAGLGAVKIRTDNTLKSHSGGVATINTKGAFSLDPSSTQAGIRIREGKLAGDTKWNTTDHMIESMNMQQKLVLEKRDPKGQPSTSTETMDVRVTRVRTGR